jgi:hypothetical protein
MAPAVSGRPEGEEVSVRQPTTRDRETTEIHSGTNLLIMLASSKFAVVTGGTISAQMQV